MAVHTKLWYFERFGLLKALTPQQRQQFAGMAKMLEVQRGTTIYLPGDPSDQIFLLKAGVIKITRQTKAKRFSRSSIPATCLASWRSSRKGRVTIAQRRMRTRSSVR